jgi:2-polyprenyl-6-methoxyphenol hydroxylase-like FAD-dependent oxidoreductase
VCKFIAFIPQWDFLNFLVKQARKYKTFDLRMRADATGLIEDNGRVVGLRARTDEGALEIRADLVVGCDGRHSTVRDLAGFKSDDLGAPMDVMWFRMSRKEGDWEEVVGHIERGRMLVMLDRNDYWQCAYVIPKNSIEEVKGRGLDQFRQTVVEMAPFDVRDRVGEINNWDDVKLLTVTVDVLRRWWKPGLICIGDAAHAMSPIGGVGINLAVQDAVAAANILAAPLRSRAVTDETLAAVQKRRVFPTRATQRMQLILQNSLIGPALQGTGPRPKAPLLMRMLQWPLLNRIPARVIALGIRPEHIRTPEIA